jgi:penicillin-binding protein 1A
MKSVLASIFLVVLVVMAAGVLYVYSAIKDIPEVDTTAIASLLSNSSVIYDDKDQPIKNIYIGDEQRELVTYEQIPQQLQDAIVAVEDKTFWEHHGFNFIRILGAIKESVFGGGKVSGTSTITQQLARNIWLVDSKSDYDMNRKIQEAYYSVQLEKKLYKEDILTHYLNTIPLGNHSYGIKAAAKNYFGKDLKDLDLVECAALASLPKSPGQYSMILSKQKGSVAEDDPNLLKKGRLYDYVYNGNVEDRIKLVLKFMLEQEKITQEEYDAALQENLRDHIVVTEPSGDDSASFFVDWAINNVAKNLMKEYPDKAVDMQTALQMVYTGGYEIHSTMSATMQTAAINEFEDSSNFPSITLKNTDKSKNILDDSGKLLLYKNSNLFDDEGVFTFGSSEAELREDGSLVLYKNARLNFYKTTVGGQPDVSIEFKSFYEMTSKGVFYITNGGYINIPQGYKSLDEDGNCIISAEFMKANPDFFTVGKTISLSGKSIEITLPNDVKSTVVRYTLNQKIRQPQSAFVILENATGRVKAMVGGRNVEGERNYNRATSPRQPGSTIKPISVYGPAIQMGADGEAITNGEQSYGKYWTPLSIIIDEKMSYGGKAWPKNWYNGFRGAQTLRKSVEQSINVNAVKTQLNIGTERSSEFLKKLGITTLVEKGATNDMNPAALALGGMTRGISPLEMASAYSAFPNEGVHNDPIAYTAVKQRDGTVILDGKTTETKAMDAGTAFIMTDILRTTVTSGLGKNAQLSGIPTAGKTGTTSEKYDFWFVGFTPEYSAAVWMGGDINIDMKGTSSDAAKLWRTIMTACLDGTEAGEFPDKPANVVKSSVGGYSDYFIKGTSPGKIMYGSETVTICTDSGYLATPWCQNTEEKTFSALNGADDDGQAPQYYCPMHNPNPGKYPVAPGEKVDTSYDPNKKEESEPPAEPVTPPDTPTDPVTPPTDPSNPPAQPPTDEGGPTAGRRVRTPRKPAA